MVVDCKTKLKKPTPQHAKLSPDALTACRAYSSFKFILRQTMLYKATCSTACQACPTWALGFRIGSVLFYQLQGCSTWQNWQCQGVPVDSPRTSGPCRASTWP